MIGWAPAVGYVVTGFLTVPFVAVRISLEDAGQIKKWTRLGNVKVPVWNEGRCL